MWIAIELLPFRCKAIWQEKIKVQGRIKYILKKKINYKFLFMKIVFYFFHSHWNVTLVTWYPMVDYAVLKIMRII